MTVNTNFNANNRNNPLLENVRYQNQGIERIVNVALPFVNLYQPAALVSTFTLGAVKSWQVLTDTVNSGKKGEWGNCGRNVVQLGLLISSISLSVLAPTIGVVITHGSQIAGNVNTIALSLWKGNYRDAGAAALSATHTICYISATVYATPELLALSLISQACIELYRSRQEFANGNILEGVANFAMAMIRFHQATPHIQTCHRNWFGKELSQNELNSLLQVLYRNQLGNPDKTSDFESVLIDRHYSSHLKNLSFLSNETGIQFEDILFKEFNRIQFNDCRFGDIHNSIFNNSSFNNCSFKSSCIFHTIFRNSAFLNCDLENAVFYNNHFKQVLFHKSDMSFTSFADSIFQRVTMSSSKLFETNFIGSKAQQSILLNNDLTDALLARTKKDFYIIGGKPHKITRPVIGFAWNFKNNGTFPPIEIDALKTYNPIVLKFEYNPDDINPELLDEEVRVGINGLQIESERGLLSIPDAILKRAKEYTQIARIKEKAQEIMQQVDGLLIPGGSDIEPEFYGQEREWNTWTNPDYRRSMIEFALLQQAKEKMIPTMGICRGSQMGNVFFGGTLRQHVEDQSGVIQSLQVVDRRALNKIGVTRIKGLSMHHQASDQIGKGLSVILKYEDVPKALISEDGNFLFTQFHPEIFNVDYYPMSRTDKLANKKFFDYLITKATTAHDQKQIA